MCGICGIFDLKNRRRVDSSIIKGMTAKMQHRGPDGFGKYSDGNLAFGFSRLSIIDLEGGMQPISNEDNRISIICNGEIFNYIELRKELISKGHRFRTNTDVETLVHLYEESGTEFLNRLNGQFAFALFDSRKKQLFCARDHFGVAPFFYTQVDDFFIFASEIKALLLHPKVRREVDLVGLDQIMSFPGLICPRTMFKHIKSLENGHYMKVQPGKPLKDKEYWDLKYPKKDEIQYSGDEKFYTQCLDEKLTQSVKMRLRSDVPVGLYISGGLDSSIISVKTKELTPDVQRYSFSIDFEEKDKSESKYQRMVADYIQSHHSEKLFLYSDISSRLRKAVYHSEYPLKETYNTASLALSDIARSKNIKVVLSGEGSDEWFAGYPGYQFDQFRLMQKGPDNKQNLEEKEINKMIWGDENIFFEVNQSAFRKVKKRIYSDLINNEYDSIDSLHHKVVNQERLKDRDIIHQRSYLDYKLRLVSHLISDHGDRMAYANSVEGRYPFLDRELVEYVATIPPHLKLKDLEEKYILKKIMENKIPREIIKREKFAFHAPGSPYLLKRKIDYIDHLLSYETIKNQGYFNPDTVEELKREYSGEGFRLNIPYETDLLIIVITFGIFLEEFQMPNLQ
jgi:asparagine synthase (glutamine-hydrolysing)